MSTPLFNWMFLDMNSYFAAVEQQFQPELRGRPVGVSPVEGDSSCCIAVSVEAKRRGLKTGDGVREAKRRVPELVVVKARPAFYVEVHKRIVAAVERCAPVDKVYSIDEMAVRLLGTQRRADEAVELAQATKLSVATEVGSYLTCSVGLAATRLLAKIACELKKPDGLTALPTDELPRRLAHLKLDDLPGISGGMKKRLYRHGVNTIEQLYAQSSDQMRTIWASVGGVYYYNGLHGIDCPEPATHRHSMGHENVLAPELRNEAGAHAMMTRLLHKGAHRLRHHGYYARRLSIKLRFESGRRWADELDLPTCRDTLTILEHFQRLWNRRPSWTAPRCAGPPIKVGICLSKLTADAATSGLLFDHARQRDQLARAVDHANAKFGNHSLYFGGMHNLRQKMDDKIAFGRVPDEKCQV